MYTELHREQPLHQLLFGWLPWPGRKPTTKVAEVSLEQPSAGWMQTSTVQQVTTSLRMQGIAEDDEAILHSLESLVLAGEISFKDFIGRLQNLFPRALEQLDVSLRMKVASLVM